jgi:hypothetical protein
MSDHLFPAWCNRIPAGLACLDVEGIVLFVNPVAAATLFVSQGARIENPALLGALRATTQGRLVLPTTVPVAGRAGARVDVTLAASEMDGRYLLIIEDTPHDMAYRQAVRNIFSCLESVAGNSLREFLGNILACLNCEESEDAPAARKYLNLLASGRRVSRDLGRLAEAAETLSGEVRIAGEQIPASELLASVLEQIVDCGSPGDAAMYVVSAAKDLPDITGDRHMLARAMVDLLRVVFRRALAGAPIISIDVERAGDRVHFSLSAAEIPDGDRAAACAATERARPDEVMIFAIQDRAALTEAIAREIVALHGGIVSHRMAQNGSPVIHVDLPAAFGCRLPDSSREMGVWGGLSGLDVVMTP